MRNSSHYLYSSLGLFRLLLLFSIVLLTFAFLLNYLLISNTTKDKKENQFLQTILSKSLKEVTWDKNSPPFAQSASTTPSQGKLEANTKTIITETKPILREPVFVSDYSNTKFDLTKPRKLNLNESIEAQVKFGIQFAPRRLHIVVSQFV
jgi:hypothetical protein